MKACRAPLRCCGRETGRISNFPARRIPGERAWLDMLLSAVLLCGMRRLCAFISNRLCALSGPARGTNDKTISFALSEKQQRFSPNDKRKTTRQYPTLIQVVTNRCRRAAGVYWNVFFYGDALLSLLPLALGTWRPMECCRSWTSTWGTRVRTRASLEPAWTRTTPRRCWPCWVRAACRTPMNTWQK